MAVTLSDDEFNTVYQYLERQHRLVHDPEEVGHIVAMGRRAWRMIQRVAEEQGARTGVEGQRN
jgi:hypothetical protein